MGSGPLSLVVAIAAVASGGSLLRAYRADDRVVAEWARSHDLTLTAENRPMVAWYLRTARILRTWGAIGGLVVPTFVALAWSDRLKVAGVDSAGGISSGDVGWVFVGYLVGALYAELSLVRPRQAGRRAASLVPRELTQYLPRRLLLAQRGIAAWAVGCVLASLLLPYPPSRPGPPAVAVLAFAAWTTAVAAGLERLQRWVVSRPQPFTEPALVAADDAIRSQSLHSIAGAGLAFLLLGASGASLLVWLSDVAVLRWTMWLPAAVATLLSMVACQRYGSRGWRVRRPPAAAPA
jgi:hypothetical protein